MLKCLYKRLIRRIKTNVSDADATTMTINDHHGHRKLAASRSADELSAEAGIRSKTFDKLPAPNVVVTVQPAPGEHQQRGHHAVSSSRFSYIYGSVSDDELQDDASSSKLGTLDQLIPVYDEFKSATTR